MGMTSNKDSGKVKQAVIQIETTDNDGSSPLPFRVLYVILPVLVYKAATEYTTVFRIGNIIKRARYRKNKDKSEGQGWKFN